MQRVFFLSQIFYKVIRAGGKMKIINNTTEILKDDLSTEIKKGSKVSVAAACFSIYAYQELKKQLEGIDELRFIFTSPTFVTAYFQGAQPVWYRV